MKKLLLIMLFGLTLFSNKSIAQEFLQGSWGVRLIVSGGSKLDSSAGSNDWVAGAQEIVDDLPTVGHVITNFTHPAHGYHFALRTNTNVDIANEIHPDFVPSLQNEQIILDVINVLRNGGKKVILYIATDGPSATGGTPDNATYKAAWESYYNSEFGGNEGAAWRNLARGFAERFKGLADGYWLDHTGKCPGGINSFIAMLKDVDPTLNICGNGVEENVIDSENYFEYPNGTVMRVSVDGPNDPDPTTYRIKSFNTFATNLEFTSGHPTPLAQGAPPNSWAYEEFTFPEIIASTTFFNPDTDLVKHAWMPMRQNWTNRNFDLLFETEQAYRFVRTLTDGNCSITWGNTQTAGKITPAEMTIMRQIDSRLGMSTVPDYIPYSRPQGAILVGESTNNRYQAIFADQFPDQQVGNPHIPTGALSSSGLLVTTTSSNTSVATIINNRIHIIGIGTTTITHKQSGNSVYDEAADVTRVLTVTDGVPVNSNNLALNGTATQSTTLNGSVASRAIDGNTNGANSGGSITAASGAEPDPSDVIFDAWWQVDLGDSYSIDDINVFNRTDNCCTSRLANFTVYVIDSNGLVTYQETITTAPNPSVTIDAGGAVGSIVRVKSNLTGTTLNLAEVEVYGNALLGIEHNIKTDRILVYPNPVLNKVTVDFKGSTISKMQITDCLGKIIMLGNIQNGTNTIDLSNLPSGLYFIKFSEGNETLIKKIIKE